ncbi:hypothetical protein TWF694_009044 [Orbilia ellipsospora]|uniref:Fungal N-terminal domain-containing protein n=1 Tax=Orbilia ellipsospora TaxID=2528407 RepID=A0AAV9XK60_9PEZI
MIEPVTLFSAIAGVTNLASRLTIDLTRLTVTLKNVPDQITQVCNEMVSLNATLNTLQQRFNPMASGYTEEQLLCLETVIASTRETLVQLAKISDACETTGKKKPGVTGIWKKMSWTLNETEIASYRSGLVGYTTMLNVLTATLADQRGANIEAMVTKTNEMLQTLMERRNRLSLMSSENSESFIPPKTLHRTKPQKERTRSSSVASRVSDSRKFGESPQTRSRSVAPSMSRRGSSTGGAPADIPQRRGRSSSRHGSTHSQTSSRMRSASTSHLPLPTSNPPPLPSDASALHLRIPNSHYTPSSHGLPSPPPEYTEIAPGMFDETPPTPHSQREIIRATRSPTQRSSTRSVSSRPTFRRALSSSAASTVEPPRAVQIPPVPAIPPTPSPKEIPEAHKLEFSGKWSVKEIRINDSFMGSGVLFLKKDDANKRALFNIRLSSSKDTRLSYRWIESSSATRTKQSSMFGGPSYVLRSLVRADDYTGALNGKITIRLEDIDYLAGQRSFMIAINLIQQSPQGWLVDAKPLEMPAITPMSIEAAAPVSPSTGGVRNFFRAIRTPSESNFSESYPPSEVAYYGNNFSRPSPPQQYPMYASASSPPTPPRSPSQSSTGTRGRRPSMSSSISTIESRVPRSSYDRSPPLPSRAPFIPDVPMRDADIERGNYASSQAPSEGPSVLTKRGRQRSKRGPTSWFSFGRS